MCGGGRLLDVTIMTGNFKNNLFVLTALQGGLREAVQVFLSPKFAQKSDFTYNPPFWYQSDPTRCDHNNCIMYILRYCIVGFGERAVSRKTPI